MPDITTSSLPLGYVGLSYSQTISAIKVVGIDVLRDSSSISDGGTDSTGDHPDINPFTLLYSLASDSEDDLEIFSVTISGEVNCLTSITTNPSGSVIDPGSNVNLEIEVTSITPGPFSFILTINSDADGAEASYTITVTGVWIEIDFYGILDGGSVGSRPAQEAVDALQEEGSIGLRDANEAVGDVIEGGSVS